jgi:hypothetical protein
LGDYSADTESLINIESGFLPSFDGVQLKLRNLANPTTSIGFGALNPAAVPHEAISITAPGVLGSPAPGIGSESGISLLGTGHISQLVNPIQNGIGNGIVFEGIFLVPDGAASSYTLLQARKQSVSETMFSLGWDQGSSTWRLNYKTPSTLVNESAASTPLVTGQIYHFCVAIPTVASGIDDVILYINGIPNVLAPTGAVGTWSTAEVNFSFGSEYNGTVGIKQVQRFFSAKVHNLVAPWTPASADTFATTNWLIAQTLYSL